MNNDKTKKTTSDIFIKIFIGLLFTYIVFSIVISMLMKPEVGGIEIATSLVVIAAWISAIYFGLIKKPENNREKTQQLKARRGIAMVIKLVLLLGFLLFCAFIYIMITSPYGPFRAS